MYSLIIVDDEKQIREGLSNCIEWNALGYELIGNFSDGKSALEYIRDNEIDVVLTDIKMVNISGLELAKYIYENYPKATVVFISAFSTFDYATEALKYGVKRYILKGANFDTFVKVMEELKEELDKKREESLESFDEETIHYLREDFANDLLNGLVFEKDELNKRFNISKLCVDINVRVSVYTIEIEDLNKFISDKWVYGKGGLYCAISNMLVFKKIKGEFDFCWDFESDMKIIVFHKNDDFDTALLVNEFKMLFNLNTKLTLTNSFVNIFRAADYYHSICDEKFEPHINLDNVAIKEAVNYINENIGRDITIKEVSKHIYLSTSYFSRLFKEVSGVTFKDYVIQKKMETAATMLLEGMKVYEVSEKVGYSSLQYFTYTFKKLMSCTPSEYIARRKEQLNNEA